jgi:hypothetical protein
MQLTIQTCQERCYCLISCKKLCVSNNRVNRKKQKHGKVNGIRQLTEGRVQGKIPIPFYVWFLIRIPNVHRCQILLFWGQICPALIFKQFFGGPTILLSKF